MLNPAKINGVQIVPILDGVPMMHRRLLIRPPLPRPCCWAAAWAATFSKQLRIPTSLLAAA